MRKHELIVETIEALDAIEFYDRVMTACEICDSRVLENMVTQDKLLLKLERLDADAYLCYITGDRETIAKYYSRTEETA